MSTTPFHRTSSLPARHALLLLPLVLGLAACGGGEGDEEAGPAAGGATAESDSPPTSWVETLGQDTMAVERIERSAEGFSGTVVARSPSTVVIDYEARVEGGRVVELSGTSYVPETNPGGSEPEEWSMRLEGDSVHIRRITGADTATSTVAAPENVVLAANRIPVPWAFVERAVQRFREAGTDTLDVSWLASSGRAVPTSIYERSDGSLAVMAFGNPLVVRTGPGGHLRTVSGAQTTMKVDVAPGGPALDEGAVMELAREFAARDARGEGVGVASPPDEVTATVSGANISVAYSQPAMRGREIWGGLVPWGEVWRTGANAATSFSTDRALVMSDGTEIPAGDYTLWSIFAPDEARLIFNSQTGQWGTQYDESMDFARVPLEQEPIDAPVERFTIDVESTDEGGRLTLTWDDRRYVATFTVQ